MVVVDVLDIKKPGKVTYFNLPVQKTKLAVILLTKSCIFAKPSPKSYVVKSTFCIILPTHKK